MQEKEEKITFFNERNKLLNDAVIRLHRESTKTILLTLEPEDGVGLESPGG